MEGSADRVPGKQVTVKNSKKYLEILKGKKNSFFLFSSETLCEIHKVAWYQDIFKILNQCVSGSGSSWALFSGTQCWTCQHIYTLATYYSASITSFGLAISPVQSLCCRGMFKAAMCIGVCLFAAADLPKLWCAVTFWHLYISAVNNVNSFSEHFDYLHIAVPMACDREEHSIH